MSPEFPMDEMPERFVKASDRDALVKSGALRIEEAETAEQPPEDNADDSPAGEDSDNSSGTDDSK